jgi:hypothetical protein
MLQCPKCKKGYDENYAFCEECGVRLISTGPHITMQQRNLVFDRIERSVFFRVTRSYAWAILIFAILVFVLAIIYLIPDIRPLIKRDISVSPEEIKIILDAKKTGKSPSEGETPTKRIDPELLAKLDKEIYELIILLPKKIQDEEGVERLRGAIKNRIGHYKTMKEKMKVLRELKNILPKFSESERAGAFTTFFNIKAEKENAVAMERAESSAKLIKTGGIFFAVIITIAAFSLILVLLAIERNTRRE